AQTGCGSETLASRALQNRAWCFTNVQLRRAFTAQPHQHARRIDPIKGRDSARNSHRIIALQTLQGLNKEHAVINFAIASLVPVYTLSLVIKLLHGGHLPSRRTAHELLQKISSARSQA